MTQSEFDRLPRVMGAKDAERALDVGKKGLASLRRGNPDLVAMRFGNGFRYAKEIVAKLGKFKFGG